MKFTATIKGELDEDSIHLDLARLFVTAVYNRFDGTGIKIDDIKLVKEENPRAV